MMSELWNVFKWVAYTMGGTQTGYPNSTGATLIHTSLKALKPVIMMLATASFVTIIQSSSTITTINSFSDLKDDIVCTAKGSTSETYLDYNNHGFKIVRFDTTSEMFAGFWNDQCTAVVYDYPALQSAIVSNKDHKATIVGPIFNEEDYGIVVGPNNPNWEQLKQSLYDLKMDHLKIKSLKSKWFTEIEGVVGETEIDINLLVIVIPCVSIIGLMFLIIIYMFRTYEDRNEEFRNIRIDRSDNDYRDDLIEVIKQEGSTDTIYMGMDKTMDKLLTPYIVRLLRVAYEISLKHDGEDIDDIEEGYVPTKADKTHGRVERRKKEKEKNNIELNDIVLN
jgi:hypothetical protein